jgi:hypothetical protein
MPQLLVIWPPALRSDASPILDRRSGLEGANHGAQRWRSRYLGIGAEHDDAVEMVRHDNCHVGIHTRELSRKIDPVLEHHVASRVGTQETIVDAAKPWPRVRALMVTK